MNDMLAKISRIEEGLKERKQMSEDFYHKEKAESLFQKLREQQGTIREEVEELEKKKLKAEAACRRELIKYINKENKLKR